MIAQHEETKQLKTAAGLEIVWRNPIPRRKPARWIRRLLNEGQIAIYMVANGKTSKIFTVILGGAA